MRKIMKVLFACMLICSSLVLPVYADENSIYDNAIDITMPYSETYEIGSEELIWDEHDSYYGKSYKIHAEQDGVLSVEAGLDQAVDLVIQVCKITEDGIYEVCWQDYGDGEQAFVPVSAGLDYVIVVRGYSESCLGVVDILIDFSDVKYIDEIDYYKSLTSSNLPLDTTLEIDDTQAIFTDKIEFLKAVKVDLKANQPYFIEGYSKSLDIKVEINGIVNDQVYEYFSLDDYVEGDTERVLFTPEEDQSIYIVVGHYTGQQLGEATLRISEFNNELLDPTTDFATLEVNSFPYKETSKFEQFCENEDSEVMAFKNYAFEVEADKEYSFVMTKPDGIGGSIRVYSKHDDEYVLEDYSDSSEAKIGLPHASKEDGVVYVSYAVEYTSELENVEIIARERSSSSENLFNNAKTIEDRVTLTKEDFVLDFDFSWNEAYYGMIKTDCMKDRTYYFETSNPINTVEVFMEKEDENYDIISPFYSDTTFQFAPNEDGTYYIRIGAEKDEDIEISKKIITGESVVLLGSQSFENENVVYDLDSNILTIKDGAYIKNTLFRAEKELKVVVEGDATIENEIAYPMFMLENLVIEFKENAKLNLDGNSLLIGALTLDIFSVSKEQKGTLTMKSTLTTMNFATGKFENVNVEIEGTDFASYGQHQPNSARLLIVDFENRGLNIINSNVKIKAKNEIFIDGLNVENAKVVLETNGDIYLTGSTKLKNSDVTMKDGCDGINNEIFVSENSNLNIAANEQEIFSHLNRVTVDCKDRVVMGFKDGEMIAFSETCEDFNAFVDENNLDAVILIAESDLECKNIDDQSHGFYYDGELIYTKDCQMGCKVCDRVDVVYSDVKESDWFYQVVMKATSLGLMKNTGAGADQFEPDANITRGMVATVLYRMNGTPSITYAGKFPDVANNLWYTSAIEWAANKGVVSGYKDGTFGPDNFITRQDLSIMLRNYASKVGVSTNANVNLDTFKDAKAVDSYATSAIAWCVEAGLMSGANKADGKYLNPKANATRAECAKMFSLLDAYIKAQIQED